MVRENTLLRSYLKDKYKFENIIGVSFGMQKVFELIEKVADTNATVLITGESGVGKELVARAIHFNSSRRDKPLVVVNCGAIPETLLESELFGYEKGAFTGATATRLGRFELADGGTIFLDEIGDMSFNLQVKLLRAIQEKAFERIGGSQDHRRRPEDHRGDKPQPGGTRAGGKVQRRPLLQAERRSHPYPAAPGKEAGHPPALRALPGKVEQP